MSVRMTDKAEWATPGPESDIVVLACVGEHQSGRNPTISIADAMWVLSAAAGMDKWGGWEISDGSDETVDILIGYRHTVWDAERFLCEPQLAICGAVLRWRESELANEEGRKRRDSAWMKW